MIMMQIGFVTNVVMIGLVHGTCMLFINLKVQISCAIYYLNGNMTTVHQCSLLVTGKTIGDVQETLETSMLFLDGQITMMMKILMPTLQILQHGVLCNILTHVIGQVMLVNMMMLKVV